MTDTSILDDTRIIRTLQIGGPNGPLTQGEFKGSVIVPRRFPPEFELVQQEYGSVLVDGQLITARMIQTYRNGELVQ